MTRYIYIYRLQHTIHILLYLIQITLLCCAQSAVVFYPTTVNLFVFSFSLSGWKGSRLPWEEVCRLFFQVVGCQMGVAPVSLRSAIANCSSTKLEPRDAIVMALLFYYIHYIDRVSRCNQGKYSTFTIGQKKGGRRKKNKESRNPRKDEKWKKKDSELGVLK